MTMSVKFCLSYDPLELDFIAFKMGIISRRKRIVDMDVVCDVRSMRQRVITRVVIRFLWQNVIHRITGTAYHK